MDTVSEYVVSSVIAFDGVPAGVVVLVGQVVGLGSGNRGLNTDAPCRCDQGASEHVVFVSSAAEIDC